MSRDLAQLPVHALAAKLKSRSVSPVDLVATCLDRIAKLDPKLHAFVEVYESEARLAAEAADKAIQSGHAIGPLHGIPIALKDLIELEGAPQNDFRSEMGNDLEPLSSEVMGQSTPLKGAVLARLPPRLGRRQPSAARARQLALLCGFLFHGRPPRARHFFEDLVREFSPLARLH